MKTSKKPKPESVTINHSLQLLFVIAAILLWLSPISYTLLWSNSAQISVYFWIVLGNQIALPMLFWVVAFLFTHKTYKHLKTKIFIATYVAWIGMALYAVVQSVENAVRYRFFPPSIEAGPEAPSIITMYGHEWLVMLIVLLTFCIGLTLARRLKTV